MFTQSVGTASFNQGHQRKGLTLSR